MMENKYDWVAFYKEFAQILLTYKENRSRLISMVKKIYENIDINLPTLEKDNKIVDIDPFTIFGLFNKSSMKEQNRIKIITAIAELFGVGAKIPTTFESIPVLNNQNATFYYFVGDRAIHDIDELWLLFESALEYANNPSTEKREVLSNYFDLAINKKGNGNSKITMGLYWIAPNVFLNLDQRNTWYIYNSGKIPTNVVDILPEVENKISATKYFEIVEKLRAYLSSNSSKLRDFKDLSSEAWRYSQQVNEEIKNEESKREQENLQSENKEIEESLKEIELHDAEVSKELYSAEDYLDDVFMNEADYEILVGLIKNKKNVILQGAPGVGKTYAAKRLAYSIMGVKDRDRVMMIQFHQSYSYEDLIEGYRPTATGFEIKKGSLYNFCKKASNDLENDYFFIIDEINRGNISKIFGELFMLIENDKRGKALQLLYSEEKFFVPKNLYIIGMMNTADRSLAMIDYALRRRFAFYEIVPSFESKGFVKYQISKKNTKFDALINCVKKLNQTIAEDDCLGEGFCIGHSYFCNLKDIDEKLLASIVEYELIPLLKEYWFDEPNKVCDWSSNLRGAIK